MGGARKITLPLFGIVPYRLLRLYCFLGEKRCRWDNKSASFLFFFFPIYVGRCIPIRGPSIPPTSPPPLLAVNPRRDSPTGRGDSDKRRRPLGTNGPAPDVHTRTIDSPPILFSSQPRRGNAISERKKYIISSVCTRVRRPRPLELFSMTCVLCCAVLCRRKKMPFSSSPPPAKAFLPSSLPPRLDGLSVACNLQAAKYCSSPPPPPLEAIWHSQYPFSFSENKAPLERKVHTARPLLRTPQQTMYYTVGWVLCLPPPPAMMTNGRGKGIRKPPPPSRLYSPPPVCASAAFLSAEGGGRKGGH